MKPLIKTALFMAEGLGLNVKEVASLAGMSLEKLARVTRMP